MELSASPCLLVGFSLLSSQQNHLHFSPCGLSTSGLFKLIRPFSYSFMGLSLFQVHGFVFLVIYCMSGLPLVWACSVTTSPGLLPLDCLQIEAFPVAV